MKTIDCQACDHAHRSIGTILGCKEIEAVLQTMSKVDIDSMIAAYGLHLWSQALYIDMAMSSGYASEDRFGSWEV